MVSVDSGVCRLLLGIVGLLVVACGLPLSFGSLSFLCCNLLCGGLVCGSFWG